MHLDKGPCAQSYVAVKLGKGHEKFSQSDNKMFKGINRKEEF